MPEYFLQAEAVNLDPVVFDTHDISTIRGGSFMLLDAIEQLASAFADRLQPIATAASQGLFRYEDPGDLAAQQAGIAREVLDFLHRETAGHATFLVAVAPSIPDNFPGILEQLAAQIRRQQWRMPTVVVPQFAPTGQECFIDGWRPGIAPYLVDPGVADAKISEATRFRRETGRRIKHRLFAELLNDPRYDDNLCAKDLGLLATDPRQGVLNGKIAFIHVDGNRFGSIRSAVCTDPDTRRRFDARIQEDCRRTFLAGLLQRAESDPGFHAVDEEGNDALRIEVLMWGGDEFTMVVPAWKGFEVLEYFFDVARRLDFDGLPMTHRAAMIFCHHNAPILQIRQLALDLLGLARDHIHDRLALALDADPALADLSRTERDGLLARVSNHRYGNAAHYLVLESFDMLRGSLNEFIARYYRGIDAKDLLLYGAQLGELRAHVRTLRSQASQGTVLDIVRAIRDGRPSAVDDLRSRLLDSVAPGQRAAVDSALQFLTGSGLAGWYLAADLWNYAGGDAV